MQIVEAKFSECFINLIYAVEELYDGTHGYSIVFNNVERAEYDKQIKDILVSMNATEEEIYSIEEMIDLMLRTDDEKVAIDIFLNYFKETIKQNIKQSLIESTNF